MPAGERAELADGAVLELFRFLVFQAEFVGIVFEGEVFQRVVLYRPVKFFAEVGDEIGKAGNGAEIGGHGGVKPEKLNTEILKLPQLRGLLPRDF